MAIDVSAIASGTGRSGTSAKALSSNFDTFLQLLTAQLKNQDPLEPMDSSEFTQQLVQYSSVEQGIYTNKNLETLIALQGQGAMSSAVSYMGRIVTAENPQAPLANGEASWTYVLPSEAGSVSLTVKDAAGKTIFSGTGPKAAGENVVTWDGTLSSGGKAPDGIYTLSIVAKNANGDDLTSPIVLKGRVTGVDTIDGEVFLNVSGVKLKLSDVSSVREAAVDEGETAES